MKATFTKDLKLSAIFLIILCVFVLIILFSKARFNKFLPKLPMGWQEAVFNGDFLWEVDPGLVFFLQTGAKSKVNEASQKRLLEFDSLYP